MEVIKWILIGVGVLFLMLYLIFARKTKSIFKTLVLFAGSGLTLLLVLYFLKPYIGIQLSVNVFTVIISSVLGAPGVIGLIMVPIFF